MNKIKLIMDMVEVIFKNAIVGNITANTLDGSNYTHVNIKFTIKKLKRKRSVAE
jgi:hypothetical protein